MTTATATHTSSATSFGIFTIKRLLKASPERVYAAWSTAEGKMRWFKAPAGEWEQVERKFDFRVGGREHLVGRWQNGMISEFDCTYRDIVPNRRIVYVYDLTVSGKKISVSLATIDFSPEGEGTRMVLTEQGAFLDGYEDAGAREKGTNALMDALEASF